MITKQFFTEFYTSPYGRLFRRFWSAGGAAALVVFVGKVGMDPLTIIDKILALSSQDWVYLLKIFLGTGIVLGLDKLRREWQNLGPEPVESEK